MKRSLSFYIKFFLIISAGVFVAICFFRGFSDSVKDNWNYLCETAVYMNLLVLAYIKLVWLVCPFESMPCFCKKYRGRLKYLYDSGGKKNVEIQIEQTLLSINIKMITNETTSNSITSSLVEENNCWMLYYTYITSPNASSSAKNPIQKGSACLEIEKPKRTIKTLYFPVFNRVPRLKGTYWTSRNTIGDLEFWQEKET